MVDVDKGHKFFFTKFHRRNFDARRIFYEKPIFALVGKGPKMTLDLEKCDFSANVRITRPISLIFRKKPISAPSVGGRVPPEIRVKISKISTL